MKYAIIDTETSALFDFKKPADAEGQPRLAHLAMILIEDAAGPMNIEFFVRPDGWEMHPDATAVNGLTTERLAEIGVPVADVLAAYAQVIDDGYVVVAYNAQYDCKVMRGELRRAGIDDRFEQTPNICVMRAAMKHGIKNAKGRGFPSISDVCAHFGITETDKHTAMGDAQGCLQAFQKLLALGALPEPAVHYAKNHPGKEAA